MDLNRIISEEINRFLTEDIFGEEGKKKTSSKNKKKSADIKKKGKKLTNGRRGEFDVKTDRETNPNLNNQDAEDISSLLDSDYINLSAVAQDVYPDHTPEGAQSQLRKKVKHLKNDYGTPYKLKKKEANAILKAITKEL